MRLKEEMRIAKRGTLDRPKSQTQYYFVVSQQTDVLKNR